jgi:outer membrane protein assembly factor BamB
MAFKPCVLSSLLLAALSQKTADWPQFGRTASFQSFIDVKDSDAKGEEWTFKAKDRMVGSPAVAMGRAWFGSDDGHMYCMEKDTGKLLWSFQVPNADPECTGNKAEHGLCRSTKVRSDPAVDSDGNVYFGSYDFNLYKVDFHGKLVWSFPTGGSIFGPVSLDTDGTVFVGSFDNHLYAVDGSSGKQKWMFDVKAHGDSGWSIAGDLVLGMSNEGGLCTSWPPPDCPWPNRTAGGGHCFTYAINKTTGALVWKEKTGNPAAGGLVAGSTYYGGSWSKSFVAYDLHTGSQKWSFDAGGLIESHPALYDGVIYISSESPSQALFAVNATTGKQIWKYTGAKEELNGSPSVTLDTVYVGSNDHYLHAVDRRSGAFKFKFKTCGNVFSSAAIDDDGRVYIACNTGTGGEPWVGDGAAYAINPRKHIDLAGSIVV